jgi:hypothetical protein
MINSNSTNFVEEIETLCSQKNMEYIDAIVHWCEMRHLEVEYAAELVKKNPTIKSKIQYEAENNNILKKTARLPL